MIDLNGSYTYSPVILIRATTKRINIYPNPVIEVMTINSKENLISTSFKIISQVGKVFVEGKLKSVKINVANLQSGYYFLILVDKFGNAKSLLKL